MGQPVVHFEVIERDVAKLQSFYAGRAYESEREPGWELLPRVNAITAEVPAMRPGARRARRSRSSTGSSTSQWRIHFLAVVSVHTSREIPADRYAEVLGGSDLDPYRQLDGLPNTGLDADEALFAVADAARAHDVADMVLELPSSAVLDELGRSHDGRAVLRALSAYLDEWGVRSRLHELAEPRHAERPEFVIDVRLLLEHGGRLGGLDGVPVGDPARQGARRGLARHRVRRGHAADGRDGRLGRGGISKMGTVPAPAGTVPDFRGRMHKRGLTPFIHMPVAAGWSSGTAASCQPARRTSTSEAGVITVAVPVAGRGRRAA